MTFPAGPRQQSAAQSLERYLRRVRKEQSRARKDLAPETVHDLRVALRRVRSLAEGFAEMEPYAGWEGVRKASKRLLDGLTELRDAQVMAEWAGKLGLTRGPGGTAVRKALAADERRARRKARVALAGFRRKRWKHWRKRLPKRAGRLPAHEAHFAQMAAGRLARVRALDESCRKSGRRDTYHRLRVALKRFRYVVESFLPAQRALWAKEMKRLQDLLGEIHDLDVLRARLLRLAREKSVARTHVHAWLARIERARGLRVKRYQACVTGPGGELVWDGWRAGLEGRGRVTGRGGGRPSRSAAIAGSHGAGTRAQGRGRPRPPSGAR